MKQTGNPPSTWRKPLAEAAVLGLLVLLLQAVAGRGFGPHWDSWYYYDITERYSQWISSWWDGGDVPPLSDVRWYFGGEPQHPPLAKWCGAVTHALFKDLLGPLNSCRLAVELISALWCSAMFLFLRPRVGRGLALLGSALFLGSPRFFLHSCLFSIDGFIGALYGLCLLSFLFWDRGWRGKVVVYIALTLGFLTKLQAYYLVPTLLLWVVVKKLRVDSEQEPRTSSLSSEICKAVGIVVLAGATSFAAWPALWIDFPNGFQGYLDFITGHGNVPVLYFGEVYRGEESPPWHYPWVFTAIAVPLWLTIPAVAWLGRMIFRSFRKSYPDRTELLLWVGVLIPLAVSSLPQAPKFDGIRHLLPAYAPLVLLAALELAFWWRVAENRLFASWGKPVRNSLLVALAVLILLPTLRVYPYNLVYYSPLIGGTKGAREKGFDLEYLSVAMHRINPALWNVAKSRNLILGAACNAANVNLAADGWVNLPERSDLWDFKLVNDPPHVAAIQDAMTNGVAVFAIISSRYSDLGPAAHLVLKEVEPIARIEYDGERLFSLHPITAEWLKELPTKLKAGGQDLNAGTRYSR